MQHKKTFSAVRKLLPKRDYILGTIFMAGFLYGIAVYLERVDLECEKLGGHETRIGCIKADALIPINGQLPR